ncbi:MAG: Molybdate metabolism regulator, partial [Myxococcaceae bacterium]|nr:Molybdate metabolism regulator [Myxococcaceae bacterium]
KDLEAIAQRQIRRLERAMVDGRAWSLDAFEARIASHPLLAPVARALVWEIVPVGASAAKETKAFRIAEDGTRADARDRAVVLPKTASIRLAHPARTPDLAAAWSPLFLDYEIVQPFEQLGRVVHEATSAERKATQLERAAGHVVPARKLLGTMESRGWRRDSPGDVSAWLRSFRGADGQALTARWPLQPAISMEYLADATDVTMSALMLETERGESVPLGKLDAVGFSEIVRDLDALELLA